MKKIALLLTFALVIQNAEAGFKGLTWHSRANCLGNNESISWDQNGYHHLRVVSLHRNLTKGTEHSEDTGIIYTWRAAIVHWNEAVQSGAWVVTGWHWEYFPDEDRTFFMGSKTVAGCSEEDGW